MKAYGGDVVKTRTTGLTRAFYRTFGGACRRVLLEWRRGKWFVDEYPYDAGNMRVCRRPGPHPHRATPLTTARRKRT